MKTTDTVGYTEKKLRQLRIRYNIAAITVILSAIVGFALFLNHSLAVRRIMFQLKLAAAPEQFLKIYKNSSPEIPVEKMAEAASVCAVDAFNEKEYEKCLDFLKIIINSKAHIEFRAAAIFESANIHVQIGRNRIAVEYLDTLIKSEGTPEEIRIKAVELRKELP